MAVEFDIPLPWQPHVRALEARSAAHFHRRRGDTAACAAARCVLSHAPSRGHRRFLPRPSINCNTWCLFAAAILAQDPGVAAYATCVTTLALHTFLWRTCLRDPGVLPRAGTLMASSPVPESPSGPSTCATCRVTKPAGTHHCRRCDHCVVRARGASPQQGGSTGLELSSNPADSHSNHGTVTPHPLPRPSPARL